MVLPKVIRLHIGIAINLDTTSAMLLPERISHCCDWGHRQLIVHSLCLDTDNSPGRSLSLSSWLAHTLVFLIDLFTRIQDQVQIFRGGEHVITNQFRGKPSSQNRQLLIVPRFVLAPEQMLILLGDGQNVRLGIRSNVVLQKDVLAEWCVSVFQICLIISGIHNGLKFFYGHVEHRALVFLRRLVLGKLPEAEWVWP